jgi:hypothetical protein
MIDYTLDRSTGILHLQPRSALEQADFERLAKEVDPFIAEKGDLAGLIVETPAFPGWSSFGAFAAHLRFVKDHHRRVRKIALVTDSTIGDVAERLVSHFVSAEIRQFPASGLEAARNWILNRS